MGNLLFYVITIPNSHQYSP